MLSMNTHSKKNKKSNLSLLSILLARCPSCRVGKMLKGGFSIRSRCSQCDYNFYPESGFYVGAIVVGFLLSAISIIPPMIIMKVLDVDINLLIIIPFIEFFFVGTFLMFYCRIIWLHIHYQMSNRLDGN